MTVEQENSQRAGEALRERAGKACLTLCCNNTETARQLWKLITGDCGGYMPAAAAYALVRAASLIDDPVPDLSNW